MPRTPRAQPPKPEVKEPPKEEAPVEETPKAAPKKAASKEAPKEEARRPRQTQQTSAEARVVEGQVPQIELFVPQPIGPKDLEPLNVYQRWNRCIGEIGLVPKRGWNDHHKYWFTTDADLNAFVGPLFAKYHLVVLPTITNVERFEPAPGAKQYLTRVYFHVLVVNADKPEDRFEVDWMGEGADTVDKGVYKAFTGGLKYFYMKLLQVATGDDPETFTRTDQLGEMAAQAASSGGQRPQRDPEIRPSNRPQPQKGGRQDEVTEVQLRQIKAMSRALELGPAGSAAFVDRVLSSNIFESIDNIENEDDQSRALTEFLKTRKGTEVGKVLYEMGQEQARRVAAREESPDAGQPQAPETAAPPGYVPDEAEMGGGYPG